MEVSVSPATAFLSQTALQSEDEDQLFKCLHSPEGLDGMFSFSSLPSSLKTDLTHPHGQPVGEFLEQ